MITSYSSPIKRYRIQISYPHRRWMTLAHICIHASRYKYANVYNCVVLNICQTWITNSRVCTCVYVNKEKKEKLNKERNMGANVLCMCPTLGFQTLFKERGKKKKKKKKRHLIPRVLLTIFKIFENVCELNI